MRTLTIVQPHAHRIMLGEKRVENRTWRTTCCGPLAIHAGKSRSGLQPGDLERYPDMVFGAVVGVAELVACLRMADILAGEIPPRFSWLKRDPHAEGPWCWVLEGVSPLAQPIPWSGAYKLFDVPDSVIGGQEPGLVSDTHTA